MSWPDDDGPLVPEVGQLLQVTDPVTGLPLLGIVTKVQRGSGGFTDVQVVQDPWGPGLPRAQP